VLTLLKLLGFNCFQKPTFQGLEKDFRRPLIDKRMKGKPKKDRRGIQAQRQEKTKARAGRYDGKRQQQKKKKKGRHEL
jgi:hypothetical protein